MLAEGDYADNIGHSSKVRTCWSLDTQVTSESPFGSADRVAFEPKPTAYQMLWGNVAMVLSSGAAEPQKKNSAAKAPNIAEIVASAARLRDGG